MKMQKLAKGLMILAILFFVLGFYPSKSLAKEKYEEKFEKTVPLAKDGKVILSNVSGNIEVKSSKEDQVKIDALKVSQASTLAEAQENAKKVTIEVNKEDSVLRIETKYAKEEERERHRHLDVSVHYRLWIPEKASAKISSVSGDVDAEGIGGSLGINVVSGDVEIRKVDKGVDCNTVSGDLGVQDVSGDTYLKSVSGSIIVNQVRGSIDAETVSGDIELRQVSEAKSVRVKAVSGDVVYEGKIGPEGKYYLTAHSGDIEMLLPSDSGFEFEAETFSGDIESDFPLEVSGKIRAREREVRGTINKGGASIKVTTFSGDISLKKV